MLTIILLALNLYAATGPAELAHARRQVLWNPPKPLTVTDWIWGPGGEARAPLPPFRFVKENLGGTNPKINVSDARGTLWIVKFGGEVHTDTFASRLLDALGYVTEATYFVSSGVVTGVHDLKRSKPFVSKDGQFRSARFKLRDDNELAYADELHWSWIENPFLGSHELGGLKIVTMLLSNWDTKDARDGDGSNTAVFVRPAEHSATYLYAFTDWGSSLGSWGGFFKRDKWDVSAYERQTSDFVKGVQDGNIVWGYSGKHSQDITSGISIGDLKWLLPHLSRITDEELRAGFMASGATVQSAERFTRSMRSRITQLRRISEIAR